MASEQQIDTTLEEYNPWLTPKRKLIAGGIVLAVAFTTIIYVVTVNTGQFFLEVSEVHERADTLIGKEIQVRGVIVNESLTYGDDRTVTFDILDKSDPTVEPLQVLFKGVPPGQFGVPSVELVIEGSLESDQLFHATSILTRESRKYVPVVEEE